MRTLHFNDHNGMTHKRVEHVHQSETEDTFRICYSREEAEDLGLIDEIEEHYITDTTFYYYKSYYRDSFTEEQLFEYIFS